MSAIPKPQTTPLALTVEQACAALSVSWDTWRAHIEPDVKIVRLGPPQARTRHRAPGLAR